MNRPMTIVRNLKIARQAKGAKRIVAVAAAIKPIALGRIPRISRLMALAIRWEGLIRDGLLTDYAEIAALSHVSRARVSQISSLTQLAPDIQEQLLFLPRITHGRDRLTLRQLLPISQLSNWQAQRRRWKAMNSR